MAITGNASYIPTMDEFAAHWVACNAALGLPGLILGLSEGSALPLSGFEAMITSLHAAQTAVQGALNDVQIERGDINLKKVQLLAWTEEFLGLMDAYYGRTKFANARPNLSSFNQGQEVFVQPMLDALTLWEKMNAAPAPAGVTLPLELASEVTAEAYAVAIAELQAAYRAERNAQQDVALARHERTAIQDRAYDAMKLYRLAVPARLSQHPALVETLPRLTPLPGHTPDPVDASALFEAPNKAKVVYTTSSEASVAAYQLRGTVGDAYDADDAVVIATNPPEAPPTFETTFGLTQAGAQIAMKVFVILNTGNEAGSATLLVTRTG